MAINEQEVHLEAHMEFYNNITISEFNDVLENVEKLLYLDFGINHVNIQPEYEKDDPKDIIVQD